MQHRTCQPTKHGQGLVGQITALKGFQNDTWLCVSTLGASAPHDRSYKTLRIARNNHDGMKRHLTGAETMKLLHCFMPRRALGINIPV